jgi:ribosomal protein S18 acetylase RimI-like enzyme
MSDAPVLDDTPIEVHQNGYVLTTNRARISVDEALAMLHTTFWAGDMQRDRLVRAMQRSVCIGILTEERLVAFARVVTDLATFAYLCDVVVDPAHGGRGLAQWMVRAMLEHPEMHGFRRFCLVTRNAKTLYAKLGFTDRPTSTYMELRPDKPGF